MRLVGTYHEQRMYVFGFVRSGQRDKTKGNRAGVVCPARCILITAAVLSPVSRFLLVPLKRIDYVQKKV